MYKMRRKLFDPRCELAKSYQTAFSRAVLLSVVGLSLSSPELHAQGVTDQSSDFELEEITVTGTRRKASSPTDVPAPVDIIGTEQLTQQGASDMIDMLRTAVPSLNVGSHPLSGTSTSVRPATLRGLSPDHTLVLINGKRRHRAADIPTFSGGISDGSQGPDISSIPAIALKQVQVLRDGAAAQYGSDAIAGVMNFILDDSAEGGSLEVKLGSTFEGDGDTYQISGSWGMSLGDTGFLRISGELRDTDMTERAVQRGDAAALIAGGNTDVPDPATRFGTPEVNDDLKTFVNLGIDAGQNREFYAFGGFSKRDTASDFFYRNPTGRFGVFTDDDDGGNYLIGDMTPNDGINCDGGIDFGGTGVVNNPIAVGSPDAASRLAGIFSDGNCFSALEMFPGGYTPFFGSELTDVSGVFGIRGELNNGLTYDISAGAGRNELTFNISDVLNPSMGSLSPTNFRDLGSRVQFEKALNVDLSYAFDVSGLSSPLNVAAGLERRSEEFEIFAGEPSSYQAGILAAQGFLIGEEAYPGYSPTIAGTFDRSNTSYYVDVETDVTDSLVLGAAIRYEDFSDFGSETTYKISGLYHITESLGVRSTFSTGFHAPTPGQQNFSALTTELDADGNLIESGVIPPTSPVALAVGGSQLEAETSESMTFGIVYESDQLSITLDYFIIEMEDRITQSVSHSLTDAQRAALIDEGYSAASGLGTFRFFTNDFASQTQGLDLVATLPLTFIERGVTNLSLTANWTKTEVTSFDPSDPNELLSNGRVIQLEENNPEVRGYLTLSHAEESWRAMMRVNYFGSFTELHVNAESLRFDAGSQITVDMEAGINLSEQFELILGADNVFNSFPDKNPWDFIVGSKYPTTAPAGINGGFYYAKVKYTF